MKFSLDSGEEDSPHRRVNFSEHSVVEQRQHKPQQKMVLLLHFAFKAAASLLYVFSGFINWGYIATFVCVLLLLSVDFWVVKNLSGRLLAGLR